MLNEKQSVIGLKLHTQLSSHIKNLSVQSPLYKFAFGKIDGFNETCQ